MKRLILFINFVLLAFILFFDYSYMFKEEIIFKASASITFVLIGGVNFIYCIKNKVNFKFAIWIMIALISAMLADIIINYNIYIGAAIFAIAHIFYFVSYCVLKNIRFRDFICGSIIAISLVSSVLFAPFLSFENSMMKIVCCVYACVISFMVGKAISNLIEERNSLTVIIAIGSVLFLFSDLMLMLNLFAHILKANYLCLAIYYPAQFLIAFSAFIYASKGSLSK